MSTTENQRKYIISSSKEFDGTILQGMGKPTIASYLRASLDPKIFIGILEEFLNELPPHSFFPPKFLQYKGVLSISVYLP
jgi:hypothetical protein